MLRRLQKMSRSNVFGGIHLTPTRFARFPFSKLEGGGKTGGLEG